VSFDTGSANDHRLIILIYDRFSAAFCIFGITSGEQKYHISLISSWPPYALKIFSSLNLPFIVNSTSIARCLSSDITSSPSAICPSLPMPLANLSRFNLRSLTHSAFGEYRNYNDYLSIIL
jgi:hypothetical protein